MHPSDKQSAFTLIELLAVVAIILILLGLLVPALSSARLRAEFAVCKSNLRQIGTGATLYASDNGEYPYCWDWLYSQGGSLTVGGYWIEWGSTNAVEKGTIKPYMGNAPSAVFLCPTFTKVCQNNPGLPTLVPQASYDMCEYYRGPQNLGTWNGFQARRSQIVRTAKEGIFCEEDTWVNSPYASSWMNNFCFGTADFDNKPTGPGGTIRDGLASFHLPPDGNLVEGFSNVFCADGHVEKVHPSQSKE